MPNFHLALYTFGQFRERHAHPAMAGFREQDPINLDLVLKASGCLGRSGYDGDPGPKSWGKQVFPRFWKDNGDGWAPSTLSIWIEPEAAVAFAYHGHHAAALRAASNWMQDGNWPGYVCWWVKNGETPDWQTACLKLEQLHDNGAMPDAFSFKDLFDPLGAAVILDPQKIKDHAVKNAAHQPGPPS